MESFARRALWDVGLNYGHGTGHGIGNFLSVHECRCHQNWCWAYGLSYGDRDKDRSSLGASQQSLCKEPGNPCFQHPLCQGGPMILAEVVPSSLLG